MLAGCGVVFLTQRSGPARVFVSRCALRNFLSCSGTVRGNCWPISHAWTGTILVRAEKSATVQYDHSQRKGGTVLGRNQTRDLARQALPTAPFRCTNQAQQVQQKKQGHQEQAKVLVYLRVRFAHLPHAAFCSLWPVV